MPLHSATNLHPFPAVYMPPASRCCDFRYVCCTSSPQPASHRLPQAHPTLPAATLHHFLIIELRDGQAHAAKDVWVAVGEGVGPELAPASGPSAKGSQGSTSGRGFKSGGRGTAVASRAAGVSIADVDAAAAVVLAGGKYVTPKVEAEGGGGAGGSGGGDGRMGAVVVEESVVLRTVHGDRGTVRFYWDAHDQAWRQHITPAAPKASEAEAEAVASG